MTIRGARAPLPSLLLVLPLSLAAACGGDDDGGDSSTCGPGTVLSDGECVPDGTVICETGTTFNEETGTCEAEISGCGEGTVLVDGECVPDDGAIEADLEEEPEPNDGFAEGDGIAGSFELPAIDDGGVVLHGCVDPYRDADGNGNPDTDFDMWLISTGAPALVEVTADGVGGLAAGYVVLPGDQQNLVDAGWQRYGLNLAGDMSRRQVYLPAAGIYALAITDSRSLFLTDGAAGSEDSCYYTTVSRVALPTPTPGNLEETITGAIGGDTLFYSFEASQGGLYHVASAVESQAALSSALGVINGDFVSFGEGFSFFGIPFPAEIFVGGQRPSDEVVVVVEPTYNYALDPAPFNLFAHALPVAPLPVAGEDQPMNGTGPVFETLDDIRWAWFDVGAGEVVHVDLAFSADSNLVFVTPDLSTISVPSFPDQPGQPGDPPIGAFNGWLRFPAAGRYYAALMQPDGDNFTATGRVTRVTPTPLEVGTPVTDASFSDLGATWHTLDTSGETWLGINAGATGFSGDVQLDLYAPGGVGEFDIDIDSDDVMAFNPNGNQTLGRIVFDAGAEYLVRVTDDGGAGNGGDSYDLSVAERTFTDLGAIDESNPADLPGETLPPGGGALYFVQGAPGDTMTIAVTPTGFNARVQMLGRAENVLRSVNAGGPGEPETLEVSVDAAGWVAFRVARVSGTGSTFDLAVSAAEPVLYSVSEGSLNYTDVCGPGVNITPANDDEGVTNAATTPFSFALFGTSSGDRYQVSTNGWLAFGDAAGAAYVNTSLPGALEPNGVVAPYWDDLVVSSICRLVEPGRVTIQWEGVLYDDSSIDVQFQAVLRSNGRIDYIYGPDHEADGASGTVGVENLGGTFGQQMVFNSAGEVSPGTSITLAPQ